MAYGGFFAMELYGINYLNATGNGIAFGVFTDAGAKQASGNGCWIKWSKPAIQKTARLLSMART